MLLKQDKSKDVIHNMGLTCRHRYRSIPHGACATLRAWSSELEKICALIDVILARSQLYGVNDGSKSNRRRSTTLRLISILTICVTLTHGHESAVNDSTQIAWMIRRNTDSSRPCSTLHLSVGRNLSKSQLPPISPSHDKMSPKRRMALAVAPMMGEYNTSLNTEHYNR